MIGRFRRWLAWVLDPAPVREFRVSCDVRCHYCCHTNPVKLVCRLTGRRVATEVLK